MLSTGNGHLVFFNETNLGVYLNVKLPDGQQYRYGTRYPNKDDGQIVFKQVVELLEKGLDPGFDNWHDLGVDPEQKFKVRPVQRNPKQWTVEIENKAGRKWQCVENYNVGDVNLVAKRVQKTLDNGEKLNKDIWLEV